MKIKTFVNTIFNSNTYLIYQEEQQDVWVIDPGSSTNEIIDWIDVYKKKTVTGIFITHSHFDHILGLNQLVYKFPNCKVFASPHACEGFESDKINGSYYLEIPFVVENKNIIVLIEGDSVNIWENFTVHVLETPGHGIDCLSFYMNGNLFTGDSLIPGIKVCTKFNKSNKTDAINSIKRIIEQFDDNTMIWPGHGKNCLLNKGLSGMSNSIVL